MSREGKGGGMRRVLWAMLIVIMGVAGNGYCANKQNASPAVVELTLATASRAIVFSPPAEDLIIQNNNAHESVYVDLKSTTNGIGMPEGTFDKGRCFKLGPEMTMELYGFITDGITIFADGVNLPASPISVLAIN